MKDDTRHGLWKALQSTRTLMYNAGWCKMQTASWLVAIVKDSGDFLVRKDRVEGS